VDAQKSFPPRDIPIEAADSTAWFFKMEVHKGIYWYTTDQNSAANLIPIPVERVREIQALNRKGKKPEKFRTDEESWQDQPVSEDLLRNNSLTRFDPPENTGRHSRKKNRRFNDKRNR
jgi:hypothetical protein